MPTFGSFSLVLTIVFKTIGYDNTQNKKTASYTNGLLFRYTIYDLVANVVHDGPPTPGAGTHRIFVLQRGTGKWFEMQDLHVNEVLPQMIPLSESLIQVRLSLNFLILIYLTRQCVGDGWRTELNSS